MKKKNKLPGQLGTLLKYAFLIAGALTMLFPFLWMILTAFKTLDESIRIPPIWFPKEWMAVNFKTVFDTAPFGQYFINTCIIATISTLLAVVVTVLASFAFSVLEFKGKKFWFWLFLSTMMVPTELLITRTMSPSPIWAGWIPIRALLFQPWPAGFTSICCANISCRYRQSYIKPPRSTAAATGVICGRSWSP